MRLLSMIAICVLEAGISTAAVITSGSIRMYQASGLVDVREATVSLTGPDFGVSFSNFRISGIILPPICLSPCEFNFSQRISFSQFEGRITIGNQTYNASLGMTLSGAPVTTVAYVKIPGGSGHAPVYRADLSLLPFRMTGEINVYPEPTSQTILTIPIEGAGVVSGFGEWEPSWIREGQFGFSFVPEPATGYLLAGALLAGGTRILRTRRG